MSFKIYLRPAELAFRTMPNTTLINLVRALFFVSVWHKSTTVAAATGVLKSTAATRIAYDKPEKIETIRLGYSPAHARVPIGVFCPGKVLYYAFQASTHRFPHLCACVYFLGGVFSEYHVTDTPRQY